MRGRIQRTRYNYGKAREMKAKGEFRAIRSSLVGGSGGGCGENEISRKTNEERRGGVEKQERFCVPFEESKRSSRENMKMGKEEGKEKEDCPRSR